jgi:hypothetical protein
MTFRGKYLHRRHSDVYGRCSMGDGRVIRVHRKDLPTPDGCRWCGDEQGHHGAQWVASVGLHAWEAPTREQRLKRMKVRRAARQADRTASTTDAAQPSAHD